MRIGGTEGGDLIERLVLNDDSPESLDIKNDTTACFVSAALNS